MKIVLFHHLLAKCEKCVCAFTSGRCVCVCRRCVCVPHEGICVCVPQESLLQLLGQGSEVEGAVGLRQRGLGAPLQLHRGAGHDGGRAAEELVRVPGHINK